jgi:hypothetical protein
MRGPGGNTHLQKERFKFGVPGKSPTNWETGVLREISLLIGMNRSPPWSHRRQQDPGVAGNLRVSKQSEIAVKMLKKMAPPPQPDEHLKPSFNPKECHDFHRETKRARRKIPSLKPKITRNHLPLTTLLFQGTKEFKKKPLHPTTGRGALY